MPLTGCLALSSQLGPNGPTSLSLGPVQLLCLLGQVLLQVALLDYYFYCILQMDTMLCVVSKSAVISAMVVRVVLVLAWWQSGWCVQKSLVFYLVNDLGWGASKLMISAILIGYTVHIPCCPLQNKFLVDNIRIFAERGVEDWLVG
ncbi:hypothetical protein GOBAR_DD18626 [Gossypium barbadense]|nr:hypothetical protein GOBAR_DD18626 [Gossypium barbadense]